MQVQPENPARICVSALFGGRLSRDLERHRPDFVVSLVDPGLAADRLPSLRAGARHLVLRCFDYEDARDGGPDAAVTNALVGFLKDWRDSGPKARLLTHCHMGARRSTAAALVALDLCNVVDDAARSWRNLLALTNKPWPNRRMVALCDVDLGRNGALLAELDAYRDRWPRRPYAYERLNQRRGVLL